MLAWFLTSSNVLTAIVDAPGEAHIADRGWGSRDQYSAYLRLMGSGGAIQRIKRWGCRAAYCKLRPVRPEEGKAAPPAVAC